VGTAGLMPLAVSGTAAAAHSPGRVFMGTKSVLTKAQVERLAAHATHRSIIIFKDQLRGLPAAGATASARIQAASTVQASVLAQLRQVHAAHVRSYHIINAVSATISTAEAAQLRRTYQFNVPRGKPSLNLGIRLAHSSYGLEGFLIDPNGEPLDAQTTANDNLAPGPTMQFFRGSPAHGRWTLVLLVALPVDGSQLREPFTGAITFTRPAVTSHGIPDAASTVLRAGHPVTATIKVTNTGNIAKDYFADPRLKGKVKQALLGADVTNVALPLSLSAQPNLLVPTNTNALAVAAQGSAPITMDVSWAFGDPDFLGVSSGNSSAAAFAAPEVAPGFFFALPEATGPFAAPTTATVNLAAVARTNPFDSAVTSTSGDVWAQSVDASAPYSPLTLNPGQTGTITLTITPTAPKGTVVHGFIGVDTLNLATASGDELINIPYSYKVG
jgi:hypothetical protein